jgi:nucleotide-binding universal stress UspA family protein
MFKRILVPTDGSDITAKAVTTAMQLAKVHGAQLLTLSVMEPFPYSAVSEIQPVPPQEFIDAQQRVASQRVEAVSAAAAAQAWPARATPSRPCTPGKPSSTTPRPRAST